MENLELLIDLHKNSDRLGPGGDRETERAIDIAALDDSQCLRIADFGCGTGASTLCLASRLIAADLIAVDFVPEFIDTLRQKAETNGLSQRVHTRVSSIDDLEFSVDEFDVIWSEGAIYNIGFERGIHYWRQFLKPKGILAISEITWLSEQRPEEIQSYWQSNYPDIDTASAKLQLLEKAGYSPLVYFVLPEHCWLNNYYRPLQCQFDSFRDRHSNSNDAQALLEAETQEIAMYETFKEYFSYGFYIARKLA